MKKKLITTLLMTILIFSTLAGCGSTSPNEATEVSQIQEETVVDNADAEAAAKAAEEEAKKKAEEENAKKAAEEAAAKEAEANEYYEAGRTSLYGLDGTEVNLETAYNNFEKAEELGKVEANFYLGVLCDWYNYPQKDYEMAKSYYEKCEDTPYAQINLGLLYMYGTGVQENKEKATEIFQTVIEQGCVEGYYGKAQAAYYEEDYDSAYEHLNKVLENGVEQLFIAAAMNHIGYLYEYGEGVEQDSAQALEWYEKANALNDTTAMNNIGYLYLEGNGVEQSYEKALEWFEKAVDLGSIDAMNNIGYLYDNRTDEKQDYAKALEWYEKAADLGNKFAPNNIGTMYYLGNGVEQSYEKALEWFEKAADLGNEVAKENAEVIRQQLQ